MSDDKFAVLPRSVGDKSDSDEYDEYDPESDDENKVDELIEKKVKKSVPKKVSSKKSNRKVKLPPRKVKVTLPEYNTSSMNESTRKITATTKPIDYAHSELLSKNFRDNTANNVETYVERMDDNSSSEQFYHKKWFRITMIVIGTILACFVIMAIGIFIYKRYQASKQSDPVNETMNITKSEVENNRQNELKQDAANKQSIDDMLSGKGLKGGTMKTINSKGKSAKNNVVTLMRDSKGRFVKRSS